MSAMLYVGACTDIHPVQRFSHMFNRFIYVDALPLNNPEDVNYTSKYFSQRDILDEVIAKLKLERAFKSLEHNESESWAKIKTRNNVEIQYFFNVRDVKMHEHKILSRMNDDISGIFIAGYFPDLSKFVLKNVDFIAHTGNCHPHDHEKEKSPWFETKANKFTVISLFDHEFDQEDNCKYCLADCSMCGEDSRFLIEHTLPNRTMNDFKKTQLA